MKKSYQDIKDSWNKISDSDWYNNYRTDEAIKTIIDNPASAFHPTVLALLEEQLGDFRNKKILVPSSGDNHAVFAFHLLGAKVFSTDISENQIKHAKDIANKQGWDIEFAVENTMKLNSISNNVFDMVYTSNGAIVWIDDLYSMFNNIWNKLKNDGIYVFYDIHPFTRPFSDGDPADSTKIIIKKPYDNTQVGENQYHWRIQDLFNNLFKSNFLINRIEEMYPELGTYWFESTGGRKNLTDEQLRNLYDWKSNPLAAIPAWLAVSAKKDSR